jgi:hypothetical protein
MSTVAENHPTTTTSSVAEQAKIARRRSRRAGLFAPDLLLAALKQAFVMLRPDIQWKNPVMFVVEIGTVLTVLFTITTWIANPAKLPTYLLALDIWLFLTVLFANFAEALAEARGKAQAEALRNTRQETPAFRIRKYEDGSFLIRTTGTLLVINENGSDPLNSGGLTRMALPAFFPAVLCRRRGPSAPTRFRA